MTKNNNQSMATVVETFIVEETQELIYDNEKLDKWNTLIEKLGLRGQETIIKDEKSPIPFLFMKRTMLTAFSELCPVRVDIAKYDKSPIPVEILELVNLSKNENYFNKIQIWYDDKTPDPVCIGITEPEDKSSNYYGQDWYMESYGTKYLIGRWGDVKMSLDAIVAKAKALFIQRKTSEIKQNIREKQRELEDIENTAENNFGFAMPTTNLEIDF